MFYIYLLFLLYVYIGHGGRAVNPPDPRRGTATRGTRATVRAHAPRTVHRSPRTAGPVPCTAFKRSRDSGIEAKSLIRKGFSAIRGSRGSRLASADQGHVSHEQICVKCISFKRISNMI